MTDIDNEYRESQLASQWNFKFKDAMVNKAGYTRRWDTYIDAYNGDYFKNVNLPEYKSNMVSNYIFSIVETIRPIMLDNDPKFQSVPRQPEGLQFSEDLQEALSYEWDRESMNIKLYRELINALVLGTSIFYIKWDAENKNVKAIPISPYNIFPDPLATCMEDAEYIIYADYFNVEMLKRLFPDKADKLAGGHINYSELVRGNDRNARISNQVLVLEAYTRGYERVEMEDGDVKKSKLKYPNGRIITLCPELGIVLDDKGIPYKDDEPFPFRLIKDYDIPGKFWGEGEVSQLISPQKYMNELNNAIIDNAKTTANMPWIVDKNSGIGVGKITSRPGLVIRKNPGSEIKREQAPNMPNYVINAVEVYKSDMQEVSGIFNTLKGDNSTGVYTAQGILALQEAGQVRIRLKVKLLEDSLGKIANAWFSRMKQYWKDDRWIRVTRQDGSYDLKMFVKNSLSYDYDFRITAGSTMPVNRGAMLDLMIRLAQTPMPDGQNLVDREAVAAYLPEEIKSALLRRANGENQNITQLSQQLEQLGQQFQQFAQENAQNDEQTMKVVEQLVKAVEELQEQIVQLQDKHDKIEEEKLIDEKENKLREDSYNKGYIDAENLYQTPVEDEEGVSEDEDTLEEEGLPGEILEGLESLSDDELELVMQQNPELLELFR